jgi:23S rRNA pseudouridine955/2504/2580 synthase
MKFDSQKVNYFEITEDNDGQRIDNFLLSILKGVPRSLIKNCVMVIRFVLHL